MAKEKTTNKKNKKSETKSEVKKQKTKVEIKKGSKVDTKKQDVTIEQTNEFSRLVKIILIVTLIFAVFYGVTLLVTKKSDEVLSEREKENKTIEKAEIQYENIMIGTMLNKSGTYYVFIEEDGDIRLDQYESLIDSVNANPESSHIYKANLTDSFNKEYLGKEENYYVSDISLFKVKGTTLVKISDGKIDSVYDNYDAIKNKLTELS